MPHIGSVGQDVAKTALAINKAHTLKEENNEGAIVESRKDCGERLQI
jgi:hypothetical protein